MDTKNITQEHLDGVQSFVQERIQIAASQNEAAAQLGISPAQIISYRDGNWNKVGIRSFNEMLAKAGISNWQTVPTLTFKTVVGMCQEAQFGRKMLGMHGYTGAGKTHALKKYTRTTEGAYYMLAEHKQPRNKFLNAMCRACGITPDQRGSTISDMKDAVCAKLRANSNSLLILDDMGKASTEVIGIVQNIYDRTEFVAGILLAGTPQLMEMINRKSRRGIIPFPEFKRRVAWWEQLPKLDLEDVRALAMANGIKDDTAIKWLHRNTADVGTLRNMIDNAKRVAQKKQLQLVTGTLFTDMNTGRDWHRA